MAERSKISNILTIDVEEPYHIHYAPVGAECDERTPVNIPPILDLLDEYSVKCTFFMVGEVAERHSELITSITSRGHEVGFHGYSHTSLKRLTPEGFDVEVRRFNRLVESRGASCVGFRAPTFSLGKNQGWVFEVLRGNGYLYDSSVFPARTQLYGFHGAPKTPYHPDFDDPGRRGDGDGFWEFPLLVYDLLGFRVPAAGGFYLRLCPRLVSGALRQMNLWGYPGVVYVHNWELDPEAPRIPLGPFQSFVTYHGVRDTVRSLEALLGRFDFTSFERKLRYMGDQTG